MNYNNKIKNKTLMSNIYETKSKQIIKSVLISTHQIIIWKKQQQQQQQQQKNITIKLFE
jgi:hypothetical protein